MAQRWKVKPKGIPTVRRNGWWVPKPAGGKGGGNKPGGPPRGGTPSGTRRSDAINKLPPREWVGSEGLFGSWKKEPRLNPEQYEWMLNPENKRWFARPRTELTGLGVQEKADIRAFDAQTGAQDERIRLAYENYANQSAADRDAGAKAFGDLARAGAAGYMDSTAGAAPDPYGGGGQMPNLSQAERALPGVLSLGAREESVARSGRSMFAMNQLPTIARSEGLTTRERWQTQRSGQRREQISGYRQSQAEADEGRRERASDLRDQNLDFLGQYLGVQGRSAVAAGNNASREAIANQRNQGANADRAAKLEIEAARLENQAQIARDRNLTSRANTLDRIAAQKRKDAQKARKGGLSNSDKRQLTKRAREMWEGIPRKVTGPDGKQTTEYLQYSFVEIVRELQAAGASRSQATMIARNVTGNQSSTLGSSAPGSASGSPVGGWFS